MAKIKLGIDIKAGPLVATLKCPHCKREHKKSFKDLRPGTSIKCQCGKSFVIKGDGFQRAQKSLDNLTSRGKRRP